MNEADSDSVELLGLRRDYELDGSESQTTSTNQYAEQPAGADDYHIPIRRSLWGALQPSALGLVMILFCFPWLEVRCNSANALESKAYVTQSGVQAIYGGMSIDPLIGSMGDELTAQLVKKFGAEKSKKIIAEAKEKEMKPGPSILSLLALTVLGYGMLSSLMLKSWRARCIAASGAGLVAGLLLLAQHASGFPLEEAYGRQYVKNFVETEQQQQPEAALGLVASAILADVKRTVWFWAAVIIGFVTPALGIIEWSLRAERLALYPP
jgi:hypothetical protein